MQMRARQLVSTRFAVPFAALALTACTQPEFLTEEPELGTLKVGEVVLVDDGSCPAGQIKEITAADRSIAVQRKIRCISR